MNSQEYANKNSLRKYPFVDDANLTASTGTLIPNNLILDAAIYPNIPDVRIRVTRIEITLTQIRITLTDGTTTYPVLVFARTKDTALPVSVTGLRAVFTFGDAVLTFAVGVYDMSAYIVDSLVYPVSRYVSSVSFEDIVFTESFTITEGSNTTFDESTITVLANAGTGLYTVCPDIQGIYSVNGISPEDGNLVLAADGCFGLLTSTNTITISDVCQSPCTSEKLNDLAHYINRVNDGIKDLAEGILTWKDDTLVVDIDEYVNDTSVQRETPYTKSTIVVTGVAKPTTDYEVYNTYFTLRLYVYNPSKDPISAVSTVVVTGAEDTVLKYIDAAGAEATATIPCKSFGIVQLSGRIVHIKGSVASATATITCDDGYGSVSEIINALA